MQKRVVSRILRTTVLTAFGIPGHSIITFEDEFGNITTYEKDPSGKIRRAEYFDIQDVIEKQNMAWNAKFYATKVEGVSTINIAAMQKEADNRFNDGWNNERFALLNYNCSTFVSDVLNAGGVMVRSNNPNLLWSKLEVRNIFIMVKQIFQKEKE